MITMRAVLGFLALMLPVAAAAEAEAAPAAFVRSLQAGESRTIVYYGTSLTAGGAWTRLLTERLNELFPSKVAVHNSGGPGMHSGWGVANLDKRVIAFRPDVVFIEFSVNDAVARFKLSPAQAKANLEAMVDRIRAALPDCEIILQVMHPVRGIAEDSPSWRSTLPECQQNYRDVAKERGLLLIDHMPVWTKLLETDEKMFRAYIPDGVHPVEAGWRAMVMPELFRRLGL